MFRTFKKIFSSEISNSNEVKFMESTIKLKHSSLIKVEEIESLSTYLDKNLISTDYFVMEIDGLFKKIHKLCKKSDSSKKYYLESINSFSFFSHLSNDQKEYLLKRFKKSFPTKV